MLRNPLYMGWLKSVDLLLRGVHPPIVSQELFDAVQGVLTGRSETAQSRQVLNADFPPRQFIRCAKCASVGDATKEVGGHWNFNVQLQFPSNGAANTFYSTHAASAQNGFKPPARFGPGPALHLENLNWNPVGDDFLLGHLVQALGSNIDPANCPWRIELSTRGLLQVKAWRDIRKHAYGIWSWLFCCG